ncbi:hypothetical protein F4561_002686 [Lipingzhangella halophila]|uniref:Uncharacterized protein n=1 Tax=Lipingzhangella halophila TaxID=1783352 RepID=A0A7W7RH24_9ACTN|nr:hypothetical protein [Lipingzhangella halophila]MBB4931866.1 hypothetical protein [Lipingzhangella halophila]
MDDEPISEEQAADDAAWMDQLRASLTPEDRADVRDHLISSLGMYRYLELAARVRRQREQG